MSLKRNQIFELLGAKPTNPRWAWCALSANHRGAIFTIWEDEIVNERSRLSWKDYEAKARPGAVDKQRILQIVIREKIPAYGLICVAVDSAASPRSIKEVRDTYLVGLQIEHMGGEIYGKHIERVHVLVAKERINSRLSTNEDGLRDLEDVPLGNQTPDRAETSGFRIVRDAKVRAHVLRNAQGECEYCKNRGFQMKNGQSYLEAHHIILLSAQGCDTVDNVIALCPNHHREAHYGLAAEALETEFILCVKNRK